MKRISTICTIILILFLLAAGTSATTADDCQTMTCLHVDDIAYVRIEDWQREGHPFAAFIKIDGTWYSMVVGSNGFTAEYTAAPVEALITALTDIPVYESGLEQPFGLQLDSRASDTTPVHFCAQLYTTGGQYFAVCGDANPTYGTMAYAVMDSAFHQEGWFIGNADSDAAVLAAMRNL